MIYSLPNWKRDSLPIFSYSRRGERFLVSTFILIRDLALNDNKMKNVNKKLIDDLALNDNT